MNQFPEFDTPHLAPRVEGLSPEQIDQLPFGAIHLDASDTVLVFNQTEARESGFRERPSKGRLFFQDVAPCMASETFRGRIEKARRAGTLDVSFSFVGDFEDRQRELAIRAQSASDGGTWIFIRRSGRAR